MASIQKSSHSEADKDGQFRRQPSTFRNHISSDSSSTFPAEAGRYALYIHVGCPWAHRTNIVRSLKGLENVIQLIVLDDAEYKDAKALWCFSGKPGFEGDPLYGYKYLKELYKRSDPGYKGRYVVPTLWDKKTGKTEQIVSNESSEIIRMFYTEFDAFVPEHLRESSKGSTGLFPQKLRVQIEAMNEWVYETINNGVYKTGFATSQSAYEEHVKPIFKSLDRIEEQLNTHQPYLFGDHITEADIRLYPTVVRFDVAYFTIFRCNLKMIRYDYPNIDRWLRNLYWDETKATNGGAFKRTTVFQAYREGYARAVRSSIVPIGPVPDILPPL